MKNLKMKPLPIFLFAMAALTITGCTKTGIPAEEIDPEVWMQTHQRADIAYVDYFSGNYIVETRQGFAVVENWSGLVPRDFDVLYAHFQFTGVVTIYNRSGNYFFSGKVVANWLSWGEAWRILDDISNR